MSIRLLAVVAVLTLQACAATSSLLNPKAPTVTLEKIKPINFSFSKQKLELTLNVRNPNAFALPMNTLNFAAQLAGEAIADGQSLQRVTIPANDSANMQVIVTTSFGKLLNQIKSALKDGSDIDYNIKGSLKLYNWPSLIPFNNSGKIENPLL